MLKGLSKVRQWYALCISRFSRSMNSSTRSRVHKRSTVRNQTTSSLACDSHIPNVPSPTSESRPTQFWEVNNISFNRVLSSYLFHGCVWNPVATKVEITQAGIEGSEKRLVGPRDCWLEGGKHVHELPTNVLLEISLWKVGLDQGGHCCGVTLLYHILKKEENALVNERAGRSIFLLQDSDQILSCSITSGQT